MMRKLFVVSIDMVSPSVPHRVRTSDLDMAKSGWTMCNAREMKFLLWIVNTLDGA